MYYDLVIKNGKIVTSKETIVADIGVKGGKIVTIGTMEGVEARQEYNVGGNYVFPGFIDEHVHGRDPGLTHKEDFYHLTKSAAAGGVTTVIEMPNSVPPVSDVDSFYLKAEILGKKSFVDFSLLGMVLGDFNIHELPKLADAGVVGFKLFWGYALNPKTLELVYNFSNNDDVVLPPDDGQIYEAFCEIGKTGKAVCIHAENSAIISRLASKKSINKNKDYKSFLKSRPSFTEALTIQTGITIAHAAKVHLHVLHIAAGEGVDLITEARNKGYKVTGETCPHYLNLTDEDFEKIGVDMKIYPPIREKNHQDRLWKGLQNRELQAIGSDHAPHLEEEKIGDIWTVPAGAAGVQTIVPAMLDSVVNGKLTVNELAALLSENPARIWGIYGKKGVISIGADADFTIVDLNAATTVTKEGLYSKNKITLYDGISFKGAAIASFLRGTQIMENGIPLNQPGGELVKPVTDSQYRW
jgi:allantoinase